MFGLWVIEQTFLSGCDPAEQWQKLKGMKLANRLDYTKWDQEYKEYIKEEKEHEKH